MSEKGHWPFNGDPAGRGEHARDLGDDKAMQAHQAMRRQRLRLDRFLVGGRAHTKKSGLS